MDYMTGYVVFGVIFLLGCCGYWVVTWPFTSAQRTYGSRSGQSGQT